MDGPFSRPTCRVVFRTLLSQRMRGGEGDRSGATWGARRRPCPRIYGMTARRGVGGRCRVVPACVPVLRARCRASRFSFSGFAHRRAVPAAPRSPGPESPLGEFGEANIPSFRKTVITR